MDAIKGFYINAPGDMTVGIFPAEWELSGEFFFEDEEEFKQFKNKLSEAFEYASGEPVIIETFEEREKYIEQYEN